MAKGCGCQTGLLRLLRLLRPPYAELFYPACCIHDDDYDRGGTDSDRKAADRRLFDNCLTIVSRQQATPWRKLRLTIVATAYYAAVRLLGSHYFHHP